MKIKVQSSTTVKPAIGADGVVPAVANAVPLTVFDKVAYDKHISGINLFHPPTPPNAVLKAGLAKALAEYREWAGRLGVDGGGNRVQRALAGITNHDEVIMVQRVRFSQEFIAKLKSLASGEHSTFTCVAAHLWRCITEARGLRGGEVTTLRVAVNGRERMHHPRVPEGYTGNAVLSARPAITAGDLLASPLPAIAELIAREVARMDDAYFRSFIDFASSGAVEEERLVPVDDAEEMVYSPDVVVDSLLGIPLLDLDFGTSPSFFFMPSYLPVEGCVFVARSFRGDRSVDAYVPLFRRDMAAFNSCCYSLRVALKETEKV
ncbi:unnamed protein product [Urochloa humidicola]